MPAGGRTIRQVELVGRKIRRLRKERRLTQSELASKIGIQQSDLSRMEKGEYRVSLDTLFKILAEFDVSVGEFFGEMAADSFAPRDVELVREFRSLDRRDQSEVRELIHSRRSRRGGHPHRSAGRGSTRSRAD